MAHQRKIVNLEDIIEVRVEPYIYAFSTPDVPNSLKIGETQRPVLTRLREWGQVYNTPTLFCTHSAVISSDLIFRDLTVHKYLELHGKPHIPIEDFPEGIKYSQEFFKNISKQDLKKALVEIYRSSRDSNPLYPLYTPEKIKKGVHFLRNRTAEIRDLQQAAIENFRKAFAEREKDKELKLLMYAVMRFGKSFTSMMCAKEMDAKLVLIVSAKADVSIEWQETVESFKEFDGYIFADKDTLLRNPNFIETERAKGNKVVVFLTLQNLQGDEIKAQHIHVFNRKWDLILVDETHFGVWTQHYGKVLKTKANKNEQKKEIERQQEDVDSLDPLENSIKELRANVKMHLSGTPYRILMDGEFKDNHIVARVQYADIAEAKQKWIENKSNVMCKEWENPYFGFPKMIRFAFTPNQSSLDKIKELEADGATHSFSELFEPKSLAPSSKTHIYFIHEDVVFDFLKVIDGSANDLNVLGFLDNKRIKEGKLCQHIVMVLPFCASCDAMAHLLSTHAEAFKNLSEYTVINISGHDRPKHLNKIEDIKEEIKRLDREGKKTISLTVNRMLTGVTVPQWDTMLFLKETASAEAYDQAIFRLQSPFIETYKNKAGEIFKYDKKPQTLLVDFNPVRMFSLQEKKSLIFNINSEISGNDFLKQQIEKDLRISPIITFDHNTLCEVTPTDIMDEVRNYAATRSILDESGDIPADMGLLNLDDLRKHIENLTPIDAKKGINFSPVDKEGSEGNDLNPGSEGDTKTDNKKGKNDASKQTDEKPEKDDLPKKIASFYSKFLFFAFLTEEKVSTLRDILAIMNAGDENRRICKALNLTTGIAELFSKHVSPLILNTLDYRIQSINEINFDTALSPIERVHKALTKFGRMSSNEVVTPAHIAAQMVAELPDDIFDRGPVLDIASKQGEFSIALIERFGNKVADKIYSICTSPLAQEFTRKVYKLLSIPEENIFTDISSFDLHPNREDIINRLKTMNFAATLGNPPYEKESISTRKPPIYHLFYQAGEIISPITTLITPGRFLFKAGQTPNEWMNYMLLDTHFKVNQYIPLSNEIFLETNITGGLSIGYRDIDQCFGAIIEFTASPLLNSIFKKVIGNKIYNQKSLSDIISSQGIYRFTKLALTDFPEILNVQGEGTKYKITSKVFKSLPQIFTSENDDYFGHSIQIIGLEGSRERKWIKSAYLADCDYLNYYNVLVPEANGSKPLGTSGETPVIGQPFVCAPGVAHTDTFLSIGKFSTEAEAKNCLKYIKTKFARCLLGIKKITQHNPKNTWVYVPMQDFTEGNGIEWNKSIDEIDEVLWEKYHLNDKEKDFIKTMVKPMH